MHTIVLGFFCFVSCLKRLSKQLVLFGFYPKHNGFSSGNLSFSLSTRRFVQRLFGRRRRDVTTTGRGNRGDATNLTKRRVSKRPAGVRRVRLGDNHILTTRSRWRGREGNRCAPRAVYVTRRRPERRRPADVRQVRSSDGERQVQGRRRQRWRQNWRGSLPVASVCEGTKITMTTGVLRCVSTDVRVGTNKM